MFIFLKEKGFTLLEVLVSFSVVLILTVFFPLLIKNLIVLTEQDDGIHPLELEIFIQQASKEMRNAKGVSVEGERIVMINQADQRVTYEFYQNNLRRRVNGTGHELLLHRVESISLEEDGNGVVCKVKGRDNVVHEFKIGKVVLIRNTE